MSSFSSLDRHRRRDSDRGNGLEGFPGHWRRRRLDPRLDRRGKRHFEDVAAGPAIEREAHELFHLEACKLPQLLELARSGHTRVQELFASAGKAVGQVLSILISTFNPEMIVLGGGVSHAWDVLAPSALETMNLWSQPIAVRQVQIVVSALGEDAGILGAAAAAKHALLQEI